MRTLSAVLVIFATIALSPASAFAESDEAKAKAEFLLGVKAAQAGRLQEAVTHYNNSIEWKPHPRTYFNLGVAAEELGRVEDALDAFENFVRRATTKRDRQQISEVRERIAALKERLSVVVTLDSIPSGADVYVDGAASVTGKTPFKMKLALGEHRLRFSKSGKGDTVKDIVVAKNKKSFKVELEDVKATLTIESNRANAIVSVGKKNLGEASQGSFNVSPGKMKVALRAAGYQDAEKRIDLKPGLTTSIDVQLEEERTTTEWIVLGALGTAGGVASGTAGVFSIKAYVDGDNELAQVADLVGSIGAAFLVSGVIYYFITDHGDSAIKVLPRN